MNTSFMLKLDRAREIARVPFVVSSGFRCIAHNRAIGGVENSAHTRGYAADLLARDSREFFEMIMALMSQGLDRFVFYPSFRVHVDDDPLKPHPMAQTKPS